MIIIIIILIVISGWKIYFAWYVLSRSKASRQVGDTQRGPFS